MTRPRPRYGRRGPISSDGRNSALAGLETGVRLVDDEHAALAADDAAILVAQLGRLQRVANLHNPGSLNEWSSHGARPEAGKIRKRHAPVKPGHASRI